MTSTKRVASRRRGTRFITSFPPAASSEAGGSIYPARRRQSNILISHFEIVSGGADALQLLFPLAAIEGPPARRPDAEIRFQHLERPLHRDCVVLAHRVGGGLGRSLRQRLDQLL